jgi:peroxiredoxin
MQTTPVPKKFHLNGPAVLIVAGIALILTAGMLILHTTSADDSVSVAGAAQVGTRFGEFNLADLNGGRVRMADYVGRPVILNIWATWCPPCQAEMPALNTYYQAHQKEGLVILGINAGETREQAAAFAQSHGLTFPILLDPAEKLEDAAHINDYPTSILVGRDGLVKAVHIGMLTPDIIEAEFTPNLSR